MEIFYLSKSNSKRSNFIMTKIQKNDQIKIWDHFQSDEKKSFLAALPRYDFLKKEAKKYTKKQGKILNIGIGLGYLEEMLLKDGFEVYALDPSKVAVQNLKIKKIKAEIGSIENHPFKKNFFDLIVISEVIEHIPKQNLSKSVSQLSNILKPQGILIATVPYNERLEDNNTICPSCGNQFHRWGHHNSFKHKEFEGLFKKKFKIIKSKTMAFPNWKVSIFGLFKAIIKYILGMLGSQITTPRIYLVAKKL